MIICNVQVVVISLPEFMNKHDIIMYIYIYINNQLYIIRYNSNPKHSTLCCSISGKHKNNQSHNITYIIIIIIIYIYIYIFMIIHM